jgi:NRPS condensation-like uncharacterized protein
VTAVPLGWLPLHEASEPFLLYETPAFRKCGMNSVTVRGPLDADAMQAALTRTIADYPAMRSRLRERRVGGRYALFWEPIPHYVPDLHLVDLRSEVAAGVPAREAIARLFRPRFYAGIDLTREPASGVYALRIADDVHTLAGLQHHVVADGGAMFAFWKRLFAEYEAVRTGRTPEWAGRPVAPSSIEKGNGGRPHVYTKARFIRESLRRTIDQARCPPARLGEGRTIVRPDRTNHQRVLDMDETARLRNAARRHGCTVNDLLSAAAGLAVDRWAREGGSDPNAVSVWIATNLRGRMGAHETAGNQASSVMIDTRPADRADLATLAAHVRRERARQMEEGFDVANFLALVRLIRASRVLPLAWRRGALRRMLEQPCSVLLSNMGVLWPEVVGGKLTGRSYLERAAELDVLGVDFDFSLVRSEGYGFVIHTFRERLTFNFGTFTDLLAPHEAENFLDLYLGIVRDA